MCGSDVVCLQALCDELSPAAKAAGVHIPEALTCTVDTEHDEPLTGGTMIQQQQQQQAKEEAVSGSSPESEVEALPSSSHQHAHGHGHGHGAAGASPAAALQAVKSRLVQFHGGCVAGLAGPWVLFGGGDATDRAGDLLLL